MPNNALKLGICAGIIVICENAGNAFENKQLVKGVVCGLAAICAAKSTIELSLTAKDAIMNAAPIVGKSLKTLSENLKKNLK
jgi:hypothetical protein